MSIADAARGGSEAIKAILARREREKHAQLSDRLALMQESRQERELQQRESDSAYNRNRNTRLDADHLNQEDLKASESAANTIPKGTIMGPNDKATQVLQRGSGGSLLTKNTTLPSTSFDTMGGSLRTRSQPSDGQVQSYTKEASESQRNTEADNARQSADTAETARHNHATEPNQTGGSGFSLAPGGRRYDAQGHLIATAPPPTGDKLVKVEHKDPTTGKTVIEWLPQSALAGQKFDKGTNATTENRLASAEAVQQVGNDMIARLSDPAVAQTLGPAMGRYSNLQAFIGNPPPEYAQFAGEIESYALANMGVHGMRSAQGAEMIKQLLTGKHTPQSLAATIRGLNQFAQHFMQNAGMGGEQTPAASPQRKVYDMNGQLVP